MRKIKQSHKNRGKPFEGDLEHTNKTYANKNWATINKTEPPFKIIRENGAYKTGFFEEKGFVDYFGICNGRSIAFEAKSTLNRTRFPFSNVKGHQVDDLEKWNDQGGIAFLLIEFYKHKEVYFVPFDKFKPWWDDQFQGGRKSIPYDWFVLNCPLVKSGRGVLLDYLKLIDLP